MRLVQRFTIVRISASSDFTPPSQLYLYEPVRVCQGLPRKTHNVCLVIPQDGLCLLKRADATRSHDRRYEAGLINCPLDCRHQRQTSQKRAFFVRQYRGHTFIAASTGVWIDRLPNLWNMRVLKLSAFGYREKIEPGARKLDAKIRRIVDPIATSDYFITQKPDADHVIPAHFVSY